MMNNTAVHTLDMPIEKVEYLVSTSLQDLQDRENELIEQGWQPRGHPRAYLNIGIMQKMVKYAPPPDVLYLRNEPGLQDLDEDGPVQGE